MNERIIHAVHRRNPDIDFQTADEGKIRGLPDQDVLAFAAREGRLLVSHDCSTMPDHFADFVSARHSPVVFIFAQNVPISIATGELLLIWETSEAEEWINTLQWLPL